MTRSKKGRRADNRRPFRIEEPTRATAPPRSEDVGAGSAGTAAVAGVAAPVAQDIWPRALRAATPGLLLAAVLLLPFVGKAFTIDDTLFMRQAEAALSDPLHPSSFGIVWSEVARPVRLSQVMPNGPLMAWLLLPAALAGGSEVVAHLLELVLLLLAIVETAALALRLGFGEDVAQMSALLLASTPAVLAMSGTVMPDVAAMTLGLVGIERLCAWRQHERPADGVLAAVALGLAPLARSHVLLLLGLAPFILGRPARASWWRQWLPVVAAPLLTVLILQITRDPLGGSTDVVRSAGLFSGLANARSNAIAFGVHWIFVLPLGLAWVLARGRRFWLGPMPWLAVAVAAAVLASGGQMRWHWFAPVAGLGIAVVADVLRDCIGQRDAGRIALGLWLLVALPLVFYLHLPSKYLVACAPAAAIVAAAAVLALPRRRAVALGGGMVAAGSLLGVLILSADETFAGLGRRAVAELVAPRVAAGEHVWFNAHWGFQWYAEQAGARCVTTTPPFPAPGDLVVSAVVTITGVPIRAFPRRELIATVTDTSPGGRIISPELGAGFYSNGWGYLPWVWGSTEVDRFELWRVH